MILVIIIILKILVKNIINIKLVIIKNNFQVLLILN